QRLKQKTQTVQGTKARFSQTQKLEIEIRKLSQKHTDLSPKHYALGTFFSLATNAALRGEQRKPPNLNHCAVNTKVNSNQNCQAL
ncbi:hypothetical protein BSG30_08620, partial [Vibrio parahaemolyticus]|uniref:hypothetical protein n=1 Tax=Vibrio parahaemolyticus TaxID=670 RepID=UPI000B91F3AA